MAAAAAAAAAACRFGGIGRPPTPEAPVMPAGKARGIVPLGGLIRWLRAAAACR